jgi:hypothetical protein
LNAAAVDRLLPPDAVERARRMSDLISTPAMPLSDVAIFLDLPLSTVDKLRREGKGPHCFKLGRRLYVLQDDLREWLTAMAKSDAA